MNITLTGNTITVITALGTPPNLSENGQNGFFSLSSSYSLRGQHIDYEKVKPAFLYEIHVAIKWYEI